MASRSAASAAESCVRSSLLIAALDAIHERGVWPRYLGSDALPSPNRFSPKELEARDFNDFLRRRFAAVHRHDTQPATFGLVRRNPAWGGSDGGLVDGPNRRQADPGGERHRRLTYTEFMPSLEMLFASRPCACPRAEILEAASGLPTRPRSRLRVWHFMWPACAASFEPIRKPELHPHRGVSGRERGTGYSTQRRV